MNFKKTLDSFINAYCKHHNNKVVNTKKDSYIKQLQDKYIENEYDNIPYVASEESAKFVLDNWNGAVPVPREYMKIQFYKNKPLLTGDIVLLWWLTSRKSTRNIPLYFSREYGINANASIDKLINYNLLSKDKKLTSDGQKVLNIKQEVIVNHKSSKSWFGVGPVKYFHRTDDEVSEIEENTYKEYINNGVDQYIFIASLDTKTCAICGSLDKQVFSVHDKKTGTNYPIIHSGCRCTTAAHIKGRKNSGKRWSRNPISGKGEYIEDMSYIEWRKNNNLGE